MVENHVPLLVPELLYCLDCDLTLLGFEARGPTPINHEECPRCGGTDFSFDVDASD